MYLHRGRGVSWVEKTSRAKAWSKEGDGDNEGAALARAKGSIREQSNAELKKQAQDIRSEGL